MCVYDELYSAFIDDSRSEQKRAKQTLHDLSFIQSICTLLNPHVQSGKSKNIVMHRSVGIKHYAIISVVLERVSS